MTFKEYVVYVLHASGFLNFAGCFKVFHEYFEKWFGFDYPSGSE